MRFAASHVAPLVVALAASCRPQSPAAHAIHVPSPAAPASAPRPPLHGKAEFSFDDGPSASSGWWWSPSEDALMVTGPSNTFAVYDVPKGTKRFVATAPAKIEDLGFAADGSRIFATTERGVVTFDPHTGAQRAVFPLTPREAVLWTSDASTVVILGGDGALRALDGVSFQEKWRVEAKGAESMFLTSSEDRIVTRMPIPIDDVGRDFDPPGVEWDMKTGARLGELVGGEPPFRRTALSPDGRMAVLESQNRNVFRLVDAISGKQTAELKLAGNSARALLGGADLVKPGSGGPAQVERLFFTDHGKALVVVSDPPNSVETMYGTYDVSVIDVATGRVKRKIPKAVGSDGNDVRGNLLIGYSGVEHVAWDLDTGKQVPVPQPDARHPSPSGRWLVGQDREGVTVADRASGAVALRIIEHRVSVTAAVEWKSMRVAFEGDFSGTLDITRGKLQSLPPADRCKVLFGPWNPRAIGWVGDDLALCEQEAPADRGGKAAKKLRFLDAELNQIKELPLRDLINHYVTRLDDGRLMIDRRVYSPSLDEITSFDADLERVSPSVDGATLAAEGTGFAALLDAKTLTVLEMMGPFHHDYFAMPGGTFGVLVVERPCPTQRPEELPTFLCGIDLFDEHTGRPRGSLDLPAALVAASDDGSIALLADGEIWDTKEKKARAHVSAASEAVFSHDGSIVVTNERGWSAYKTADGSLAATGPGRVRPYTQSVSPDGRFVAVETEHGVRLVRIDTKRSLEIRLVRTEEGIEPLFVLDTGHFTAAREARSHIRLRTEDGDVNGDAPENAFRREDVWLDFLAP